MVTKKINKRFPFQVWVGSIIFYTIWAIGLSLLATNLSMLSSDFLFGILLMFFASAYVSIPTFLLYLLLFFSFTSRLGSIALIKMVQSIVAILGMLLTFELLPESSLLNPGEDLIIYLAGYAVSICATSVYFKLGIVNSDLPITRAL
jgi:ABC-type dipeptide/oligopeptide/nickel transport system permease component